MSTVGIIIDVIIVAILVIFGIIGFNKGFLKSIISLFSWVVCLVIAILTAKYVASWINGIYDFSSLIGGKIAENREGKRGNFAAAEMSRLLRRKARLNGAHERHNSVHFFRQEGDIAAFSRAFKHF